MRYMPWDKTNARKKLSGRLRACKEERKNLENTWNACERVLYFIEGIDNVDSFSVIPGTDSYTAVENVAEDGISINRVFKNFRLLHSQLASNPPAVQVSPSSLDVGDKEKAAAADRVVRYNMRKYSLQDRVDLMTMNTMGYGTGILKTVYNPDKGELLSFDRESGELLMTGDCEVQVPLPKNVWLDPDAPTADDIRFVFERFYLPYETLCYMFPDDKEVLEARRSSDDSTTAQTGQDSDESNDVVRQKRYDTIEVYQYWETGLPENGMEGRFVWHFDDGTVLGEPGTNPFAFSVEKDEFGNVIPDSPLVQAYLPYIILTDLDVPNSVWGKPTIAYQIPLQEAHNALLNTAMDVAHANGIPRLVLNDEMSLAKDSPTDRAIDVVKINGQGVPQIIAAAPMPDILAKLMEQIGQGEDQMAGVNESMFGEQSRETAAVAMQYATQQGNAIRKRLFNKYTMAVENLHKNLLRLEIKHWTIPQTIQVLGEENAYEVVQLKGSDIAGGYDLRAEYGTRFSLDPIQRRQEIIQYVPIFEKAEQSKSVKQLVSMLDIAEINNLFDKMQQPAKRQKEIFDVIIKDKKQIPPREIADHAGMLEFAYEYVMTAEFRDLETELQTLIDQHIKLREQIAASAAAPGGAAPDAGGQQVPGAQPGGAAAGPAGPAPTAPGAPLPAPAVPPAG